MKPLIAIALVLSLSVSSVPANVSYASNAPMLALTQTATSNALQGIKLTEMLKTATPKPDDSNFSKSLLHTATTVSPFQYELYPADFATNRWQKYVTSIFVQATDISFIVSTIYADGSLVQTNISALEEVQQLIEAAQLSNDTIRAASVEKPDKTFLAFYTEVYLKSYEKMLTGTLIPYNVISKYNLAEKAPQLMNTLIDTYDVYKKGSFYLLTTSVFPSGNRSTYVSSSLDGLEKQLNKIAEQNQKLLIENKLIAAPTAKAPVLAAKPAAAPQFYVVIFNADKTYSLKIFATAKAASAYMADYTKANKKVTVKIAKNKDELLKMTKGLKEKK